MGVSLAVSLLTLFSMTKIWANAFWGAPEGEPAEVGAMSRFLMTGSTVALVGLSVAIAVWAGPLYELSERAAADLIDPGSYVRTVLGR